MNSDPLTSRAQPSLGSPLFSSLFSPLFSALCLFSLWGCENPIDTTPNVFPDPVMEEPIPQEPSACSDCLVEGSWYRFDQLELKTLDGEPHPVVGVLNGLWGSDVEAHVLNVLFEVRSVTETEVVMGAMNAAWVSEDDDGYCLMPETAIEFTFVRDKCAIENVTPAGINIYAGSIETPKNCSAGGDAINAIPVRDVILGGVFTSECGVISEGSVISAAIKQSALESTCSCLGDLDTCVGVDPNYEGNRLGECGGCNSNYNSLARQLTTIRPLEWNCQIDGEPAVCLEAGFNAQRLSFTPSSCE